MGWALVGPVPEPELWRPELWRPGVRGLAGGGGGLERPGRATGGGP